MKLEHRQQYDLRDQYRPAHVSEETDVEALFEAEDAVRSKREAAEQSDRVTFFALNTEDVTTAWITVDADSVMTTRGEWL